MKREHKVDLRNNIINLNKCKKTFHSNSPIQFSKIYES